MKVLPTIVTLATLNGTAAVQPASVGSMRWHQRIVLLVSPKPEDTRVQRQRRVFSDWHQQAADRDVVLVEVSGSHVAGASDSAASLVRRYRLATGAFQVLLIGKDGHVALRATEPVEARTLQDTIDAMPMRKAGER